LPEGPSAWEPWIQAPADYEVVRLESPFECPDGAPAELVIVRPAPAAGPAPVAVLLHEGAFDYAISPTPEAPLAGPTWRSPTRLGAPWAVRRAWAVAGLWTTDDPAIDHAGALPVALAETGHVVLIPGLCWGDMGANAADNAALDGFARNGRVLVTWTWRAATEPGFLAAEGVDPGFEPDPARALLAAAGQGARGAAAILHDTSLARPASLLLDSVEDDLDPYYDDPASWADVVAGLDRIWPGGRTSAQALRVANATRPPRTALVLSAADPRIPAGTIDELSIAIQQQGGRVVDTSQARHVQMASDIVLARDTVMWLTAPAE
jgi:hypothetical protein